MSYSWAEALLASLLITAFQWVCMYATLLIFCSSPKRKISKADRGELYSQRLVNDAAVVGASIEDLKSREPE
ncbi:hypothetical protein WR25_05469 [Diploscapter pachys]|uniref:Uncharacterized protein n=1 Tax=Diploscapter pachys TaxID=2018661 RepID=A0A2A2KM90_9BILA|nr:hypothetical protein WR25_05469 [Diploscapter pachys]